MFKMLAMVELLRMTEILFCFEKLEMLEPQNMRVKHVLNYQLLKQRFKQLGISNILNI